MKRKAILLGVLLFSFVTAIRGQTVPTSPSPLVIVSAATPNKLPGIDPEVVRKFHPNTFLLTNESDKNIVGLMIRWTYTDAGGRPGASSVHTDSLDRPKTVLLGPHATLIVAPKMFFPVAFATVPHVGPTLADLESSDGAMVGATNIQASIDLIVWQDGEIAGPNVARFDEELAGRKLAATVLASQIRNALAQGVDPKETLKQTLLIKPDGHDLYALQTHIWARSLVNARDMEKAAQFLEGQPDVPKFYRRGQ